RGRCIDCPLCLPGGSSPVASSSASSGSVLANSGASDSAGFGGTAGTASAPTPAASSGSAAAASSVATKAALPGPVVKAGTFSGSPPGGSGSGSGGGGSGPLTADSLSVDVVDQNNGLVLSPNVPVNDFSTYGV